MYLISELAVKAGLSRTTLLYYEELAMNEVLPKTLLINILF